MTNICFLHHSQCIGELDAFISLHGDSHISTQEAVRHIEKLLLIHFTKMTQFTPKHLGRAQGFGGYAVYWLHMIIPSCNLSRTQFPKVYFYKEDHHICFLCLDSHVDDYKDAKLRKLAETRLTEMLEVLKAHVCNDQIMR